ncbi:tyrosine-type recombinase/integrase [Hespellia stercorisuis]|uniref:Site-specific recombinase XerD n=1 Tax=Hespellia stercorisuis DSM 15480 TaxID=1121950 RepID=A0A1M6W8D3_9FIRM|nr:tyrosine-type recombinase/integrase [Hespellia stercorisuis]SHK89746.1 Site-specific recombinase XerD [Hespellia stercorisuis DSM 15480]
MKKRIDNRKRLLHSGESQRKDGRYAYKYIDANGEPKFIYSWKLVATDKVPKGKRNCISLREQIKEIQRDLADGIDTLGKKMTLCELYAKQNRSRANVRKSTVNGRKALMDALQDDKLGNRAIDSIKPSDAKEWAIRMKEKGFAYSSISNFKRSLTASFHIAINDDYVRKNPFNFNLKDVIADDTKRKEALTEEQQEKLLSFAEIDSIYKYHYNAIIILLNTGLRISELCGLTVSDIDFENRFINIDHQLLKDKDGYYIEPPKSESGFRQIPMSETVCKAFQQAIENRNQAQPIIIDGYSDFIFLNKQGNPMYNTLYTSTFKNLVKKYCKYYGEDALPNITPHILRHTFCTNMANKGMTPNNLQYVMGHKNVNMTLNYYSHGSSKTAQVEMLRIIA